jgi:hypothetical protein
MRPDLSQPALRQRLAAHESAVGGFHLVEGQAQVALAEGSQRLLALLAIRDRPVKLLLLAGTL